MFQRYFNTVASLGIGLALIARAAAPMGMAPAPAQAQAEAQTLAQTQAPWTAGAFGEICAAHAGHDAGAQGRPDDGSHRTGGTCHHCVLCQIVRPIAAAPVMPVAISGPRGYTPVAFHTPAAALVSSPTLPFRPGPRAPPIPS
ncbi:MAG: hypothetical protein WCF16_00720, partial [Alphaproteobacteria bacterium]